ncbi:Mobile element protein [bacterium endosymbiont of Bathymodiolus sp. 5 South]|nr:Mobile element protein [bacterium endosymbiont of Bathymodiolus sp. 5 South]VVH64018.1 hypothetical protein BSPWISOX_2736 [uncultured Gammaproteobacteria bacterium]
MYPQKNPKIEPLLRINRTRIFFVTLRDLCINRNNHQKPTFHPLGDFLNPALALLGQGLKKSPIRQKLDFANHPYLCKGLS